MRVLELRGYKSLKALQAFHSLMLGLKMLPAYVGEKYEDFYARVSEMPESDQEKMIREAVLFVDLPLEEVSALVGFCADGNGVPYGDAQLKAMGPKQIHEIIVAVCMEISRIKIDFVTDAEKKKSLDSRLIHEQPSSSIPS
jgi:hypothetical protein